jgi:hypothetical protein
MDHATDTHPARPAVQFGDHVGILRRHIALQSASVCMSKKVEQPAGRHRLIDEFHRLRTIRSSHR